MILESCYIISDNNNRNKNTLLSDNSVQPQRPHTWRWTEGAYRGIVDKIKTQSGSYRAAAQMKYTNNKRFASILLIQ